MNQVLLCACLSLALQPPGGPPERAIQGPSLKLHDRVPWIQPAAEPVVLNPYGGWIDAVTFDQEGTRILADTDKALHPLDLNLKAAGEPREGHRGMGDKSWFSPDGRFVYVASWTTTTTTVNGKRKSTQAGELTKLDREQAKLEPLAPLSRQVASLGVSADGARLALGFENGSFQILNAATGQPLLGPVQAFHGIRVGKERIATVTALAFTPDGKRLVLGDTDGKLRFFDAGSGMPQGKPVPGHSSLIEAIAFTPDGQHLITSTQDGGLYQLNPATGTPRGDRLHIGDKVTAMALRGDGALLVTGHFSGKVRLWRLVPKP